MRDPVCECERVKNKSNKNQKKKTARKILFNFKRYIGTLEHICILSNMIEEQFWFWWNEKGGENIIAKLIIYIFFALYLFYTVYCVVYIVSTV